MWTSPSVPYVSGGATPPFEFDALEAGRDPDGVESAIY